MNYSAFASNALAAEPKSEFVVDKAEVGGVLEITDELELFKPLDVVIVGCIPILLVSHGFF